jgi:hypothetical protein
MFGSSKAAWQRGPTAVDRYCGATLIGFFSTVVFLQAIEPDIEGPTPRAFKPGVAAEVKFGGRDLGNATNVWANFPARFESLGERRFRFTPPADWPVGVGALRLYGPDGASQLCFLMLDDLPTVAESKTNKTRATAQRIEWGSAVDGFSEELGYDWFQVPVSKGKHVAIEVVATRLGSRLDSVLRVFDSNGKQIAQNDDAPGLRGDSYLAFTAPTDGDYFIELRDVNYTGNSETHYHLRVGDFPLATTAFPGAVNEGANTTFRMAGPAGDLGRIESRVAIHGSVPLALLGAKGSAFTQATVTTQHEIMEREPNDKPANATKFLWSNGINGRFDKANDRDCYEFTANKGERLEFRAATRSLGAPCDAILEVQSSDGKTLARSNPTASDEGIVVHKFATNGAYRLMVEEAIGAFGANCVYHIAARHAAGFALSLESDTFNAAPAQSFNLKVNITRGDYKGAVKLALEGIESLTWTNSVIGEGKSNVTLKVTVPESLPSASLKFFNVIGTAQRDGTEVRVRASTAPALRRWFPLMLYPPAEFDGEIALGTTGR